MTKISNQYSLTNVLFADAVNGRVGIGTTSPSVPLDVVGAGKFANSVTAGTGSFGANGGFIINYTVGQTSSRSWRIINDQQVFGDFAIQQSTTQTGTSYNQPFYINPSGNVGIGTTSPSNPIHISSASNTTVGLFEYTGGANAYIGIKSTSGTNYIGNVGYATVFETGGTERMRITSAGNVGIGTTSPFNTNGYTSFTINGTTGSIIEMLANGTRAMQIVAASSISYFYGALNTPMAWYTNANERMRITEGGDVCVATTTPVFESAGRGCITIGGSSTSILSLKPGGNAGGYVYHNGSSLSLNNNLAGGVFVTASSGGVQLNNGATSWTSSSDERLKNINSNIEDAVNKLSSLRAVNFSWKSDETQKEVLGLIAQDVEKVFPQVVDKSKLSTNIDEKQINETEYLGVRYTELVPVLVKAIQELSAQASEQQLQINELKALLNA